MLNKMNICMTCNDDKHYEMKVHEAEMIAVNIKRIVDKYSDFIKNDNHNEYYNSFNFDHKHQHFLCGNCYKINIMSLQNAERKIKIQLSFFCSVIKGNKEKIEISDYKLILRNLSGHYPGMYKTLEQYWYKL